MLGYRVVSVRQSQSNLVIKSFEVESKVKFLKKMTLHEFKKNNVFFLYCMS